MKVTNPQDLINYLQKQPYHTRVRILWGTVGIVAIVLFALWILNIKSTIKHIDTSDLVKSAGTSTQVSQVSYAMVERAESGTNLKLYFNLNNPSDDILNVPTLNNISLIVKGRSFNPTQMTDRQGGTFVQKILSHQQNFGILVFPKTDLGSAELTFSQMFFERTPDQMLSQKIELDLNKLQKTDKLRN